MRAAACPAASGRLVEWICFEGCVGACEAMKSPVLLLFKTHEWLDRRVFTDPSVPLCSYFTIYHILEQGGFAVGNGNVVSNELLFVGREVGEA
jgi:hypothetical protein